MKKLIGNISTKFGFTNTEVNVVLFIIGVFIVGLLGKFYKYTITEAKIKSFDYREQDSLFLALNQKPKPISLVEKILEKKVDSKQELSNFRVRKKGNKKKNNSVIKEKSINLNTAGIVVLMQLPGIGEKTASNIVEFRNNRSGFNNLSELKDVKGIGETKFERIKKYLFIDE
ncbi:MAG: helix-hairpin-helix domain-containing protein [Ignavibacteriae bacterium]|nr:helix-hairpin-helix domain-containing protein [Ignavibacteriota bacterium]